MTAHALAACWLWLLCLVTSCLALTLLSKCVGARPNWTKLFAVHADEAGSVQSLSFVLTLPLFIMILLFIVQVSQLMIATVAVHYAAYAAARSAIVWIPADVGGEESENRVAAIAPDPEAPIDGPGDRYVVIPSSPKYRKIHMAAVLACAAVSPSRSVGQEFPNQLTPTLAALEAAYAAAAPSSRDNARTNPRLRNKLAYSYVNTNIVINVLHRNDEIEPPLAQYNLPHNRPEFMSNEFGWQDLVRVEVTHDLALLPGPGRLLARRAPSTRYQDSVSDSIVNRGSVYTRALTASATLGLEGDKSLLPYRQQLETTNRSAAPAQPPVYEPSEEKTPSTPSSEGEY